MYKYGNLLFHNQKGWLFITNEGEKKMNQSTLVACLNELGKRNWELTVFNPDAGYILKKEE